MSGGVTLPAQAVLWATVLMPAVVGVVLVLVRRLDRLAGAVAVGTAAVGVALAVLAALARPAVAIPFVAGSSLAWAVDPLSATVLPTLATVALLVLVFATADTGQRVGRRVGQRRVGQRRVGQRRVGQGRLGQGRGRFFGLMLLFVAAAAATTVAVTLPALLFAWELMGATSYALIGYRWRDRQHVASGLTAFLTTRTADLGLYAAAGAALAGGAGLALGDLAQATSGWRDVVALGVLVAALGKAAQLPFSFWLSRAMAGPSPVSALLHSAAMVALGAYLLLRTAPLLAATGWAGPATAWVGVATAVALGVVAVAQRDLKQLLAASTAAQLGFVVLAAGVYAVGAGAGHLVAHAATKALLFLVAGAWLSALGTERITELRGAARATRVAGVAASVGLLSLAGVAPLALWATKDSVLAAAREESAWLYLGGLLAAALSAAYAGKVVVVLWRTGDPRAEARREGAPVVPEPQLFAVVALAVAAVATTALGLPPLRSFLASALASRSGTGFGPTAGVGELVLSAVIALLVVLAVTRWRLPEPALAARWLDLERLAHALVVRPTVRLAYALARFDDRVVDRAVTAGATGTARLARGLAGFDARRLDGLVEAFAARVRRAGDLARRPQTGQLHHYYLQAAAVLAIGVVSLLAVR